MADDQARITLPAVTLRQAEALVGLAYVDGEFDCAHLAVMAQEYLFGRTVHLPLKGRHPAGRAGQAAAILRHRDELASRLEEAADVATGDAVLFTFEDVDGRVCWHIGTLLLQGGERWVLHTSEALRSSVLQRLDDCMRDGLFVEGFYRWRV